jgi:hypothetical protein
MVSTSKEVGKNTVVTMTFRVSEEPEKFKEWLRVMLLEWGADAVADFIDGNERWTVNGEPVEIVDESSSQEA